MTDELRLIDTNILVHACTVSDERKHAIPLLRQAAFREAEFIPMRRELKDLTGDRGPGTEASGSPSFPVPTG
jgi:hypothetical protein